MNETEIRTGLELPCYNHEEDAPDGVPAGEPCTAAGGPCRQRLVDAFNGNEEQADELLERLTEQTFLELSARADLATVPLAKSWLDLSDWARDRAMPPQPQPEIVYNVHGMALLYRGRVNRIFGPSGDGKTWVAAVAAVEVLGAGGRVAWIDLDKMGPESARRLLLLGVDWEAFGDPDHLRLYTPDDSEELAEVVADVTGWSPDLVVLDSLGELLPMVAPGDVSNSPDATTRAWNKYIQPLAGVENIGPAVFLIDHTSKGAGLTSGSTGTTAKHRPLRGVSIRLAKIKGHDLAPGHGGKVRLLLDKDTSGTVRAYAQACGAKRFPKDNDNGLLEIGALELTPVGNDPQAYGSLEWVIYAPLPADIEITNDNDDHGYDGEIKTGNPVTAYVRDHPAADAGELDFRVKGGHNKISELLRVALYETGELRTEECPGVKVGCSWCEARKVKPYKGRKHLFVVGDDD